MDAVVGFSGLFAKYGDIKLIGFAAGDQRFQKVVADGAVAYQYQSGACAHNAFLYSGRCMLWRRRGVSVVWYSSSKAYAKNML